MDVVCIMQHTQYRLCFLREVTDFISTRQEFNMRRWKPAEQLVAALSKTCVKQSVQPSSVFRAQMEPINLKHLSFKKTLRNAEYCYVGKTKGFANAARLFFIQKTLCNKDSETFFYSLFCPQVSTGPFIEVVDKSF